MVMSWLQVCREDLGTLKSCLYCKFLYGEKEALSWVSNVLFYHEWVFLIQIIVSFIRCIIKPIKPIVKRISNVIHEVK